MHTKDQQLIDTMLRYGGSFVKSLARTMSLADPVNYNKLCKAFPEIIKHHTAILEQTKSTENARPN